MWRSDMGRWGKTRQRGFRAFVLRRGMLGWGLPMFVIMSAMQIAQHSAHWRSTVLIGLPLWLFAGVIWGALAWALMEWLYRRRLRSEAGS